MTLLLDTCALLWWLGGDGLSDEAVAAIASPDTLVAINMSFRETWVDDGR